MNPIHYKGRGLYLAIMAAVVNATLLSSCINAPPPPCPLSDLLLDQSLFPSGTYAEPLVSPIPEYPRNSFSQGFWYEPDDVIYDVEYWYSQGSAEREYSQELLSAFDEDAYMGPWELPKELTYSSSIASNYHLACGPAHYKYQCRMIGTYNTYFVYLKVEISEHGLNYALTENLLRAIDNNMRACINP